MARGEATIFCTLVASLLVVRFAPRRSLRSSLFIVSNQLTLFLHFNRYDCVCRSLSRSAWEKDEGASFDGGVDSFENMQRFNEKLKKQGEDRLKDSSNSKNEPEKKVSERGESE